MKHVLVLALAGLTGLTATFCRADEQWAKINRQLDFNGDGKLEGVELLAGYMNVNYPGVFNLTAIENRAKRHEITLADLGLKTNNGQIESALPGLSFSKALDDYYLRIAKGEAFALGDIPPQDFGLTKPAPMPTIAQEGQRAPANTPGLKSMPGSPGISLARSASDLLAGVKGLQQPAYLSYVKNDRNGSNQVLVQGVLAGDIGWQENWDQGYSTKLGNLGLDQVHLLPSVSFDKATNQTDVNNNVDSLVFRAGTKSLWLAHPAPAAFDRGLGLVLNGNLTYATDFEMREEIPSGELDLIPIANNWGFGQLTSGEDFPVQVQALLDLHLEGGEVLDRGHNTKLQENSGYLRGGPQLGLTFVPSGSLPSQLGPITFKPSDLVFNVSYLYYARAAGIEGNAHMLQASGAWAISGSDNMSLVITYRNGITPLQLQSAHFFSVGLGLKF